MTAFIAVDSQPEHTTLEQRARLVERIFTEVYQKLKAKAHVPTATYRLQFNKDFTFNQAREIVGYLARLGISDLYASPYFKARPGSMHGYDIVNHNELNPEMGTLEDYEAMVAELHRQGMTQILDTVPNHMGIGDPTNIFWMDVLENGRSSVYAPFFDIDWNPINTKLTNQVLLPTLGEQYGVVLENKELQITFTPAEGKFTLHYYDSIFPINPRSYDLILDLDKELLFTELGEENEPTLEYQSILTAINHLPFHSQTEKEKSLERNREKEIIKRRLATLCAQEPRVEEFIQRNVEIFNGEKGSPRSFDLLDKLLERQAYRLSFWRVAAEEINYRRFFDVNELAAVRIDQLPVFRETHRLLMQLLREGKLNGLRIDHVDGLRNPWAYFQNLQQAYYLEMCRAEINGLPADELEGIDRTVLENALLEKRWDEIEKNRDPLLTRPLFVSIEKILGHNEVLPGDWSVCGTTGYEFTNALNSLFVEQTNQKAFDDIYFNFIGEKIKFADLIYETKKQIMRLSLASEIMALTNLLNKITENDRRHRDFTLNSQRNAIREVIACFPVYRTYITPANTEVEKRDQIFIENAVTRAKRRNTAIDPSIFDFIRDILLLKGLENLSPEEKVARFNFIMKFQQTTGPVIAKGLEDTAFYIYNRLIALNEVGGEPDQFGISQANFHRQQADRQRNWPFSILTTSTHDTKRSEDVRLRIDVLSEIPQEWRQALGRWTRFNKKHKKTVEGQLAPSRNEEYFLYQTLLGVWPFEENLGKAALQELTGRVQEYMRKAMNEAKVNSSWVNPNEPYQQAVAEFIAEILTPGEGNRFLPEFMALQKKVAHFGALNSLSQALIKITSPGVPDFYQGNELWDFSLVDPDNRRPVDYKLRQRLLTQVEKVEDAGGAAELLENKADGRVKLFVTSRALNFRRQNHKLFYKGNYNPLEVQGVRPESVLAFARTLQQEQALVVAPVHYTGLSKNADPAAPVTGAAWANGWLVVPGVEAGQRYRNLLTGEELLVKEQNGTLGLALDEILAGFPVALLEKLS
ncbi:MAG: malto-oligosyltrehalose synthase [Chloroflexi bacterium]|nr:malto-oligosyltrehalose synthase [Chloroflexota bacterium]